jgi:quercetin dioxygenase-like cupin family protein
MSTETDTYHLFGNLLRFLIRPSQGAAYLLVETLTAPGAGAPLNRHPEDDEAFYVLEGTFEFTVGNETFAAHSRRFVKVPPGEKHSFKNVGHQAGRLLVLNSPGKVHEGFFSQAGEAMPRGTTTLPPPFDKPDIQRVVEVGRRNGLEFLLPNGGH